MQTIATLTDTQVDIKTHLISHITFGGCHGLAAVTLADKDGHTLWVSKPYLDGVGAFYLNHGGRWVEHQETVPSEVANATDRIDILQSWHGVNTLEQFLVDLYTETIKALVIVVDKWLTQPAPGPAPEPPPPVDDTLGQLSDALTRSGSAPQHTTRVGLFVPPAVSSMPSPGVLYVLFAKHSGKCLDISGASMDDGAKAIQWQYWGGANEAWEFVPVDGDAYMIKAKHSGKCLDVGGLGDHTATGNPVQQWAWCNGNNQKWRLHPQQDGTFSIAAVHSGKVLDVGGEGDHTGNGCPVNQWDWWGGDNQRWRLAGKSAMDRLHR